MPRFVFDAIKTFLLVFISLVSVWGRYGQAETVTSQNHSCKKFYSSRSEMLGPSRVKIQGRTSWYLHEPAAIGDGVEPHYTPSGKTVTLKEAAMTNQCRTSECYLFSTINFVNTLNLNVHNFPVTISEPYLVAHKFLQHVREGVWYGTDDARMIHDLRGGFSYESVHLMRKVGLVEKSGWKPLVPYENWDMATAYSTLEKKVPQWHSYIQSLAYRHGSWEAAPVRQAELEAYEELKNIVLDLTGPLPQTFEYQGRIYTPQQFEQVAGIPRQRILSIDNKEGNELPSNINEVLNEGIAQYGGQWRHQTGDYDTIINETIRYIDAGHPVIIDFHWKSDGHSMLVVGYETQNGYVTRLKVMNSWGTTYGNGGYGWYTLDDVWENVARVYKFGVLQ